jgi:hypothetical protein
LGILGGCERTLEEVQHAAEQASALTAQLLPFASRQTPLTTLLNVNDVVVATASSGNWGAEST